MPVLPGRLWMEDQDSQTSLDYTDIPMPAWAIKDPGSKSKKKTLNRPNSPWVSRLPSDKNNQTYTLNVIKGHIRPSPGAQTRNPSYLGSCSRRIASLRADWPTEGHWGQPEISCQNFPSIAFLSSQDSGGRGRDICVPGQQDLHRTTMIQKEKAGRERFEIECLYIARAILELTG